MQDDRTFNVNQLTRLQRELAAIVRQYRRAVEAHDSHAQEIETQAICNRIRCLLYHHLDLRMGMSSENWVWLNAADDDCEVQRCGSAELRASGRMWCSLPAERLRQWTEPFAVDISHSEAAAEICDYTIRFGSRATMLDLPAVRRLIDSGEVANPRAPNSDDGWAHIFRMGEHS